MKKTFLLLLALMLLCAGAQAASLVRYEGGAEEFVFLPGSEYSETDMFKDFKNVVPGDVITQRILLKNSTSGWARIYLRVDPPDEHYRNFLSRLNLKVSCKDKEIFDAAASETGNLTENFHLGTFRAAGTTELILTLTIPYDLGNEFMGAMGVVPWTFLVEQLPEGWTPETGDSYDLTTWLIAAAMILAAIAYVLIRYRRQKKTC